MAKKLSFFERLTGSVRLDDEEQEIEEEEPKKEIKELKPKSASSTNKEPNWMKHEEEEGQLTVDVYQTPTDIYVQTMVAGVRPEDLQISITRDMISVRGKREESRVVNDEDYFTRELYWGSFSRTISLPAEVEPEDAEAIEKHGLLIIRLPKINKDKQTSLRVKSI
jgi:HSP20 family protein